MNLGKRGATYIAIGYTELKKSTKGKAGGRMTGSTPALGLSAVYILRAESESCHLSL